ncbi:transcriptional regulator [Opitutaceae bacterium TAV1]|nr:transcriptional regulator [Opitutaceae bacterium TAV1]
MAELGKLAGCSAMTVSLALRNSPRVSAATRKRIQALAAKHAYRPNPLVVAFNAHRRRSHPAFQATVGFVTCFGTRAGWKTQFPAYRALRNGLGKRAEALGYTVEEFWIRDPEMPARRLRQIIEARGVRGLVLAPLPADGFTLPAFDWSDLAVVATGYSIRKPDFHRVSHDYFHGMMLALERCRAKGYRRIGFFVDRRVNRVIYNLWLAAWLAEQRTTAGAPRLEALLTEPDTRPDLAEWARRERLDAVVGLDVWDLEARGMVLPPGVARVALNADEAGAGRRQPGISRNFAGLGAAAMDRLAGLLHANDYGVPACPQTTLIAGTWMGDRFLPERRHSCRC